MNTQKVLAVGSLLLQYPGDDIVEIAEQIRKGIILLDSDDRADINEFLNWLSDSPIIEMVTLDAGEWP
jgi:nitrate reductase assembly molybdenum cofactor insertion protein NarJ